MHRLTIYAFSFNISIYRELQETDLQTVIGCLERFRQGGIEFRLGRMKGPGHVGQIYMLPFLRSVTALPQEHVDGTQNRLYT